LFYKDTRNIIPSKSLPKKIKDYFFRKNIMEDFMETLYANGFDEKDPNCKTCKNKTKPEKSGIFWFAIWMLIMSAYGNFVLFKQIINFIF
jgi:hypothetical protein